MVFNLLEFNNQFKYYWWLDNRRPSRYWNLSWGEDKQPRTTPAWRWPTSTPPEGVEIMDPRDYPEHTPLNRQCNEDNIHQTMVAEYDTMWARREYLKLHFRVYQSITKRIIGKIVRKGLEDANNEKYDEENIVETITSFLPSGVPVDSDGMQEINVPT
jgi:hypothetical protein